MLRALLCFAWLPLVSCGTARFYTQGAVGQAEILLKSRDSRQVISAPETAEPLRERLRLTQELRAFASEHLALPAHKAYGRYADLGRSHVIYTLNAAPEFSMEPHTWRYPIVGDLEYRGHFRKEEAEEHAERLRAEGFDVHVGGTDAYSTLGFFHDPVLNTFADYPEIDFAELIFHELTHIKVFRKGETAFNESLANMVAEEGVRRWLISRNRGSELAQYDQRLLRRRQFHAEVSMARDRLTQLYASGLPPAEMRLRKQQILAHLKHRTRALQRDWGSKTLDAWLALDLTNAHLLSLATYNDHIPAFREILAESGNDFEVFFQKVRTMDPALLP